MRRIRKDAGLTQEQVAAAMDWSLSKLIRIEGGGVSISVSDLRSLLTQYKISDGDQVEELVDLARAARQRAWFSAYRDITSPQYVMFVGYEAASSVIRQFEPTVVPGQLQTEEYARAVTLEYAADRVDKLVELRMRRQELLEESRRRFHFILDEAVIRRRVGAPGHPGIMRRQLRKLVETARQPNVTIQVVPFSAGVHPGLKGPFTLLEFIGDDEDVLYLENASNPSVVLTGEDLQILTYREAFERLREQSLSAQQSIELINQIAEGMTLG
ncbi:MAG: helix-turn-helix transcriptional regulator [Actinobacteria bacterium]|nr:helix-turn-helix transcriptional regulator [Actinomycetota bacterium]